MSLFQHRAVTEYDLKLLRVFKAVVENGGFAAAEDELGITRSTISIHMSSLETRLRLKLCSRGRSGFVLTPDGQVVYKACLKLFAALGEFSGAVSGLSQALSGELVILHADILDEQRLELLAQVVARLNQQAPELTITLDGERIDHIEQALLRDKAHIGLFPGYRKVAGLHYAPMFQEHLYLCCARSHPLFETDDANIDDALLAGFPAVMPGLEISPDGREQLKKLKPGASAYQFDSRKALIASGRFIGYLPYHYIQTDVEQGRFRFLKPECYHYPFEQSLVHKQGAAEPKKVDVFLDLMQHLIAQQGEKLSGTLPLSP
ncbi:HTH-type transcriptional activator BauR [Saliniradius amylolyticus]|uniref:HTH-type transcriptional activator BauR n=1 Tax=Saliniradius amylolyticus TaxID=2183582 RepID=A0A2S2DZA7_9ALTE|nr:LysR family transcriptional regulator [Saliniradius amylolyticus]AWL10745.1 HTH-type transcriptional activator BauR [Saliniradius amylolyticus]